MLRMNIDTRRRISDLADDLLDAGNDPPAAVLDELRRLVGPPVGTVAVPADLAEEIDRALRKATVEMIAFANDTPYTDDPRWSPWTRWQKPLADRCSRARDRLGEFTRSATEGSENGD